jgi:hypothetical protein
MMFPEQTREGSDAHGVAVGRVEEARADRGRVTEAYEASRSTPGEPSAGAEMKAADDQVAAREAWLGWVERGC